MVTTCLDFEPYHFLLHDGTDDVNLIFFWMHSLYPVKFMSFPISLFPLYDVINNDSANFSFLYIW